MSDQEIIQELEQRIKSYQEWRDGISKVISDYQAWLTKTETIDYLQELRLYEMGESLRKDQITLAFVAEFSRGKTETINALFFSDFNQRLLPSEAGRTTMCPTEIFYNPDEEPYIKLLPIESRKRDDTLAYLKTDPNAWTKIRLNVNSSESMREALYTIVHQKPVSLDEAKNLGLWNPDDYGMANTLETKGIVEVPTWRHALINYPHPLLKSGLVILDTPGLNTLGAEPELTLSIIPNAHAIVFLLATDTGVTKSDMQIWTEHIRTSNSKKLAILNKIDILWDAMKTEAQIAEVIESQIKITSHQLGLNPSEVLAISAQKALLAKIKKDPALLAKSGIQLVEKILANDIVGAKHEIICKTVVNEIIGMLKVSRRLSQKKLEYSKARYAELDGLRGKNQDVIQALVRSVTIERRKCDASKATLNIANERIRLLGKVLTDSLSNQRLNDALAVSKQTIGESWTTITLNRGMKDLMKQTSKLAEEVTRQASDISLLAEEMYELFRIKHGFDIAVPDGLSMKSFTDNMQELERLTERFCADPINVMTEKHFLIRKFFISLGGQTQAVFEGALLDCEIWLGNVLRPLKKQIRDHEQALEKRQDSLKEIADNLKMLETNLKAVAEEYEDDQFNATNLDQMLLGLMQSTKALQATSK